MKAFVALLLSVISVAGISAQGKRKSCEELKAEIEAKIRKNGVREFILLIETAEKVEELERLEIAAKVVGSCDGGTKRILYSKRTPCGTAEGQLPCG